MSFKLKLSDINVRSPLSRRLILSGVIFSSFITLIITGLQLYGDYKSDVTRIEDDFDEVKVAYLETITNSVWVLDQKQINAHLEGLLRLPDIEYVDITVGGEVKWSRGKKNSSNAIERGFPLIVSYNNQAITVGILTLQAGLDNVYQRIVSKALFILIANGVKTFLFVGFMLIIIYHFITRHIAVIANYFHRPYSAEHHEPLQLLRAKTRSGVKDELDELVDAINNLHTQLQQSHNSIRERGEKVQLLLDSTAEAIYGIDAHRRIIFVNPSCVRMLGYDSQEQLLGKDARELFHNNASNKNPNPQILTDSSIAHTQTDLSENAIFRRKDGGTFPVELWSHPISHDGEVKGAVVTFLDITQRQKAEQALRESEARFRTLAKVAPVGIYQTDKHGNCVYVNEQWCEIAGMVPEQAYGDGWIQALHCDDKSKVMSEWCEAVASQRMFRSEYRFKDGKGRVTWVWGTALAELEPNGEIRGYIGTITDITLRKQAEQLLERNQERLELMVAERTAELAAKNNELESFCYSVSHDLRAPLRAIDGFCQILLEDHYAQLDDSGRGYLQRSRAASQRMSQLIDDLLSLSRVGRAEINKEIVDLSAMVLEIGATLQESQPRRRVEFRVQKGITVCADRKLLHIAMVNLLDNAWKFTAGTNNALIEVAMSVLKGCQTIVVRDNGAGFDMRYADKLFRPFQRLHAFEEYQGTGIGLATVQRVVARHGGTIWAQAEHGKGAAFFFTLNHNCEREKPEKVKQATTSKSTEYSF